MKQLIGLLVLSASLSYSQPATTTWDLTITTPKDVYPSWMQFSGGANVRIVGRVSSVHDATEVKANGSHLTFTTSEWFGKPIKVAWDVTMTRDKLTGIQRREDGVEGKIVGVLQPRLDRDPLATWTAPEPLFNGKNLDGWKPDNPAENHWRAVNSELVNESAGANIRTTRKFQDFKLHIEYNCPDLGNSGVYLRGRYEIQVEYEKPGTNDNKHGMGSIYGFIAPSVDLPRKPGEWESFDVTFVGNKVTVMRNGINTIDNQTIPGITGGAIDSNEGKPGPLYIQGDHTGGMKYRNITISVPER